MSFQFTVGIAPPPLTVAVPNVVGQMQAMASAAIMAAKLVVGTVTSMENPAQIGQVLTQMPMAGMQVTQGGSVDLMVSSGPPPVLLCTDPVATNVGGPLPCIYPPPPVDLCPNIDGVQETIPAGLELRGGLCLPPIPPPSTDSVFTFKVVCKADGACALTIVKP